MDYHIHQGNQASTWVGIRVAEAEIFVMPSGFLTWTGEDVNASTSQVFMTQSETLPLFAIDNAFATELNASTVSSELRERFCRNNIELSPTLANLQVTVKETDRKWLLTDTENHEIFFIYVYESDVLAPFPDRIPRSALYYYLSSSTRSSCQLRTAFLLRRWFHL